MADFISEKVIEDILSSDGYILSEILEVESNEISLIARQKKLECGILDLLYLYKNELMLIELKVVPFYEGIIKQINGYYDNLKILQHNNKVINGNIRKIILVTQCLPVHIQQCKDENIQLILYQPELVLSKYYENFREISYFLKIQSGDYGVVRIGLIKSTLYFLSQGKKLEEISKLEQRSEKTIKNCLSVGIQLNLVAKHKSQYFLTEFGNQFLSLEEDRINDRLNNNQVNLLSKFVRENPFHSSIIYTTLILIESVFVLAKNVYPVPFKIVADYFVKSVGKTQTWKTNKARHTASYIFSNYACELELLTNIDNKFYITPKGNTAILLLQLNRSLKLIESQSLA
jgi:hypothetical protein